MMDCYDLELERAVTSVLLIMMPTILGMNKLNNYVAPTFPYLQDSCLHTVNDKGTYVWLLVILVAFE